MLEKDIDALLHKAEELKALFVLGQRVVPFLEEIFVFIREIKPLLDEINYSIEENIQKMPRASTQLSQVTQATEMATTEIMDTVEQLMEKAGGIGNNFSLLKNFLSEKNFSSPETDNILKEIDAKLEGIRSDSSNIMMALQVQDITSQQIAAVNHLLETIQDKLTQILKGFRPQDFSEAMQRASLSNVSTLHREIAFDPDAVSAFHNAGASRQNEVDSIVSSAKNSSAPAESISQDDIDALFRQS